MLQGITFENQLSELLTLHIKYSVYQLIMLMLTVLSLKECSMDQRISVGYDDYRSYVTMEIKHRLQLQGIW